VKLCDSWTRTIWWNRVATVGAGAGKVQRILLQILGVPFQLCLFELCEHFGLYSPLLLFLKGMF
jgi:hypothetical protein